jgi:isoquinoline 1-oxidoreductase alpha subunit
MRERERERERTSRIVAASALLAAKPKPSAADIEASISNDCRCGTYARIKQAILAAAG